jgi:hypothetical protein
MENVTITVPMDKVKQLAELAEGTIDQTIDGLQNELIDWLLDYHKQLNDTLESVASAHEKAREAMRHYKNK